MTDAPVERNEIKNDDVVVELTNVHAGYLPGVNILNGANLVAHKGELIGIIGPNGAGKSTLLKAIFGMVNVRDGDITVKGESIVGLKADKLVARGVAFVPQTNNVFPSLTIQENLEMGLYQNPKIFAERLSSSPASSANSASASSSVPDRCPAASARWWPCRARS